MTLRTPRRRISPRTKRRYRAIKDFFRRALGSTSQQDININSSIAVNVTDLKHKIVGLEQRLSEVNKHCLDLACQESISKRDSHALVTSEDGNNANSIHEQTDASFIRRPNRVATKLLYKTSDSHYGKSDESNENELISDSRRHEISHRNTSKSFGKERKLKKKCKQDERLKPLKDSQPKLRRHKTQSVYENFVSSYSTSSYHSLMNPRTSHEAAYSDVYNNKKQEYNIMTHKPIKLRKPKNYIRNERPTDNYKTTCKTKNKKKRDLDEDFIAEIIKRQYKPIEMFGRKGSGISQFSAPVCRDQEYPVRENIIEGSELCSCCFDGRKNYRYQHGHDLSDIHSICDTQLYSSKRETRHRHRGKYDRRDVYNDSEFYDLIPVKEKASPKCRRKVPVETAAPCSYYKEVPPSPRTLRPRLNLKAQYYSEFEEYMQNKRNAARNHSFIRYVRQDKSDEPYNTNEIATRLYTESNDNSKLLQCKKAEKDNIIQHDAGTMSSLQSPMCCNGQENVTNSTLNKTQDTALSIDKTDRALSEIKDILQSFLLEMKKETVTLCDNSGIISKNGDKCLVGHSQDTTKLNPTVTPNSGVSVNDIGIPQCNVPPHYMPFANPCCYPIFSVCPMNCIQNGYVVPTPSFTCASCLNSTKDSKHENIQKENKNLPSNETEELIKEIYKFVAQKPNSSIRNDQNISPRRNSKNTNGEKILTCRSVGGSSKLSKHDAKVGTPKIRCYSKSCEAIVSKMTTDTYYNQTNPTYSDTVLERLSLEVTPSSSESEASSDSIPVEKERPNKFVRVLRSFGLLRKKKDIIEELSESESTVEVDVKPKPPFKQEVTNYVMHGQEFYNQPPVSLHGQYHTTHQDYRHTFGPNPPTTCMHTAGYGDFHDCHKRLSHPCHSPRPFPSAPPYLDQYNHMSQPQVPLCLKEIEVKSIGTQSERKMGFFRKFTKKMQGPAVEYTPNDGARNCSTQTAGQVTINKPNTLGKFNWKSLQAKINELDKQENMNFSYKTQKRLAEGDMKMRNAMLKKLFYKRNPFSPRNLIMRTILGKDKSSFGEPPAMYRPRMFF